MTKEFGVSLAGYFHALRLALVSSTKMISSVDDLFVDQCISFLALAHPWLAHKTPESVGSPEDLDDGDGGAAARRKPTGRAGP